MKQGGNFVSWWMGRSSLASGYTLVIFLPKPDKRPRSLSLKEQVKIIRDCHASGVNQHQEAVKWEWHREVACRIWKLRDKLSADDENGLMKGCHECEYKGKSLMLMRLFTGGQVEEGRESYDSWACNYGKSQLALSVGHIVMLCYLTADFWDEWLLVYTRF